MTLQQAIKELYPDPTDPFQDPAGYTVAHPDSTADLITRIQRGAYIAAIE